MRRERWSADGENYVVVDVDDNEMVVASYPLLRKMLLDLGFAPVISAARVTEHYHTKAVVERDALFAAADDLDRYVTDDGPFSDGVRQAIMHLRDQANGCETP